METYGAMKERHQAEVNRFPLGFAFSDEQFANMMRNFGLPNDKSGYAQIVSLGGGCYLKRADIPAWEELMGRHEREKKELRKSEKKLIAALRYEFANHECQFIRNDEAVCACVGLDWEEVQNDAGLMKIYNKAWKLFWNDCLKNDWF